MGGSAANVRSMRAIGLLCQNAGLRVMEASGWTDRGRDWGTLNPAYVICHHTAAPIDVDRVLIDGRSDLPGPLCNFALHADGTVILIASGLANHAGVASISSTEAYGIEATGPIPLTGSGPSAFPQYEEYLTLVAAIRLHHGWGSDRVRAHKEVALPDGRKPDPAFGSRAPKPYPDMDTFRVAVDRRVRTWGLEESELTPEDKTWIEAKLDQYARESARWTDHGNNTVTGASNHHKLIRDELAAFRATIGAQFTAVGVRLDALEELLTADPTTPAATTGADSTEAGS